MAEKTDKLLEDIRSLIILQLSQSGVTSEDIGKALGVKGAQIRKIRSGLHK
jgi:predicted ArsR family transcriptional regulator